MLHFFMQARQQHRLLRNFRPFDRVKSDARRPVLQGRGLRCLPSCPHLMQHRTFALELRGMHLQLGCNSMWGAMSHGRHRRQVAAANALTSCQSHWFLPGLPGPPRPPFFSTAYISSSSGGLSLHAHGASCLAVPQHGGQ
jgi:hypothetical protein